MYTFALPDVNEKGKVTRRQLQVSLVSQNRYISITEVIDGTVYGRRIMLRLESILDCPEVAHDFREYLRMTQTAELLRDHLDHFLKMAAK